MTFYLSMFCIIKIIWAQFFFETCSKNNFKSIFRFLDNESSFTEELKIISSFPKWILLNLFLKTYLKLFGIIYKF